MFEELKALLVEKFLIDEKEITPDAELAADLGINSIELAELLDSCAEKFNINIDDDSDIPTFVTVGDIVEFMEKNKEFPILLKIRSETENSICFSTFLRSV